MPYGAAQMALLEQIIAGADALHLTELSFEARMQATTCYVQGGEPARAVVTFTWCLSEYDRDPRTYGGYQHLMLWHFKYTVAALTRFPEVALDRTYAVLDDMQRRWTETGHSLHAVYAYRHFIARHVGDLDQPRTTTGAGVPRRATSCPTASAATRRRRCGGSPSAVGTRRRSPWPSRCW